MELNKLWIFVNFNATFFSQCVKKKEFFYRIELSRMERTHHSHWWSEHTLSSPNEPIWLSGFWVPSCITLINSFRIQILLITKRRNHLLNGIEMKQVAWESKRQRAQNSKALRHIMSSLSKALYYKAIRIFCTGTIV